MLMRVGAAVVVGAVVALLPSPGLARQTAETLCNLKDDHLEELSGLATTGDGYVTVNDNSNKAERRRIFFLDGSCRVDRAVAYPSKPTDTEDLAVSADGTVWVADIGDNDAERETVGLWKLTPGADGPAFYDMRYPDGAHDAETLVLNGDGTPVVVTKDPAGARIYALSDPPAAGATGTLRAAGSIDIPATSTSNPRDADGRRVLTGGTTSPDGTKVAIRTYADAFEYVVRNGDVVAALTGTTPKVTGLPDEPQGESIAYSRDGTSLLTVSESAGTDEDPTILRYASKLGAAAQRPEAGGGTWVWIAVAVAIGAGLILLGVLGVRRRTRRG